MSLWNSRAVGVAMAVMLGGPLAAQQVAAAAPTASERVGGRVVSDVDGHAMAHVALSLTNSRTLETVASTTSDEEGHFQFEPVAPGKYSLMGVAAHSLPSYYLQHGSFWTAIVTGAGLATGDLELRMIPAGTISGRVVDDDGERIENARVQLYREDLTSSSRVTPMNATVCNDEGEFEFSGLARGRYYLSATGRPWYAVYPRMEAEDSKVRYRQAIDPALDVAYPMEFYPDALNSEGASALVIEEGEHLTATMQMHPQHALTLTVRPPTGATTHYHQAILAQTVFGVQEPVIALEDISGGVLRFDGIAPGQYTLAEFAGGSSTPMRTEPVDLTTAPGSVELGKLGPMATVVATVHGEDGAELSQGLQVSLRGAEGRRVIGREISEKGEATIGNVAPGDYVPEVFLGGRQLGVAAVSVEGKPVKEGRIQVGNGGSEAVDVRVSTVQVEVDGFVRRGGKADPAAMVVLVPAGSDTSEELFRRDQSDLDGSFVLHNVLPGNYIVVAIDDGWPLRWTDVSALAPYLMHGLPVTIGGDGRAQVQLARPVVAQPR